MAIYPKTYNEVMRFKRCMQLKTYIPECDDEMAEKAYLFVSEHPENKVSCSGNMLSFMNYAGEVVFTMALASVAQGITSIELTGLTFSVTQPYVYSGGDGGVSGNNNNNNNNNNNG